MAAIVAGLVVGLVFCGFRPRSWLWGGATVVAGLLAAWLVSNTIYIRRVRQWTRQTLIPEAQRQTFPSAVFSMW